MLHNDIQSFTYNIVTVDKPLMSPDPEFLREPHRPGAGPAQGGQ